MYGQQKGARFIGLGMDARSAGELGGRPTKFTLGNVAAELELEPRRANLLGAFEDAADGPADEADGQDEPADAADGAAA